MKISLKKTGDTTTISMSGYLDLRSADSLKNRMRAYFSQSDVSGKILFNLDGLKYIGSSGIRDFISMLEEFYNDEGSEIRCSGVNDEFKKIFRYSLLKKDILDELFDDTPPASKMDV